MEVATSTPLHFSLLSTNTINNEDLQTRQPWLQNEWISLFIFILLCFSLLIYTLQEFHHCSNNKLLAITTVRAFQPNPSSPITMALSLILSKLALKPLSLWVSASNPCFPVTAAPVRCMTGSVGSLGSQWSGLVCKVHIPLKNTPEVLAWHRAVPLSPMFRMPEPAL